MTSATRLGRAQGNWPPAACGRAAHLAGLATSGVGVTTGSAVVASAVERKANVVQAVAKEALREAVVSEAVQDALEVHAPLCRCALLAPY